MGYIMNIDIIKTSNDAGAVYIKYQTHKVSPTYEVTLPFTKNSKGLVEFNMTEETLRDLVHIFQQRVI